jgi:hypothetical protein
MHTVLLGRPVHGAAAQVKRVFAEDTLDEHVITGEADVGQREQERSP